MHAGSALLRAGAGAGLLPPPGQESLLRSRTPQISQLQQHQHQREEQQQQQQMRAMVRVGDGWHECRSGIALYWGVMQVLSVLFRHMYNIAM